MSFSHAETAEYGAYDLLLGGAARQLADGLQCLLRIGEDSVGGQAAVQSGQCPADGLQTPADGGFLPGVGQKGTGVGRGPRGEAVLHSVHQQIQPTGGHGVERNQSVRLPQALGELPDGGFHGGVQIILADG